MLDGLIRRLLPAPLHNRALTASGFLRLAGEFRYLSPNGQWSCARLLEERARQTPAAVLLEFAERRWTCAEIAAASWKWAHFFRSQGIGAGSCVALLLPNGPTLLTALAGINCLGAKAALLNPTHTSAGIATLLQAVPATAVLVDTRLRKTLDEAVAQSLNSDTASTTTLKVWESGLDTGATTPLDTHVAQRPSTMPRGLRWPGSDATMCYVFTSGTSGLPKAAIITNLRWLTGAAFMGRSLADAGPDDIIYCALPLYHNTALSGGWATALMTGARLVLRERFSAREWLADIRKTEATIFLYIGELCRYLLAQPPCSEDRNHNLRVAVGVGLGAAYWLEFQTRFGIKEIREMYGATEGNAAIANYAGRPGMLGQLGRDQQIVACDLATGTATRDANGDCQPVSIGEAGLLIAKVTATSNFDGYRDRSASESKLIRDVFRPGDCWFNSGDLLRLHDEQWVSFVDRLGDTFRWKGENVSTTEVATYIETRDDVMEAIVYGVEFPGSEGRAGMVCLVPTPGQTIDLEDLATYIDRKLASHQRPIVIRISSQIRTTATHKQLVRLYRDEGWDPKVVDDPMWIRAGAGWQRIDPDLAKTLTEIGLRALPGQSHYDSTPSEVTSSHRNAPKKAPKPILSSEELFSADSVWTALAPLRAWFRPEFVGLENIDKTQPSVFVANHSLMGVFDILTPAGLSKYADIRLRGLHATAYDGLPGWESILRRLGGISATGDNMRALLAAGESPLVYPGGIREVAKRHGERYHLLWGDHIGWVRNAVLSGAPLVPLATVGLEDALTIVLDADQIQRSSIFRLFKRWGVMNGLPRVDGELLFPPLIRGIGPTPLPRPIRCTIAVAEPIPTQEWRKRANDREAMLELRTLVRARLRDTIEEHRNHSNLPPMHSRPSA